jgi:hypothetical protein
MLLCAPTNAGKTKFIGNLLRMRETKFVRPPDRIVYCYGTEDVPEELESLLADVPGIELHHGLVDDLSIFDPSINNLLIIDDLFDTAVDSPIISSAFYKGRHRNISCILTMQYLYYKGKESKVITRNASYCVLFRNPRDLNFVKILGQQMGMGKVLESAYILATKEPYSYLVCDFRQTTPPDYMLRSNILGDIDGPERVYVGK